MKRLYVHIGRAKTGTSAIQAFLAMNAGALAVNGVKYAKTGSYHNTHHPLAWSLHKAAARSGGGYWKRASKYAHLEMAPGEYWSALRNEIKTSAYDTFVVSSEEFGVVLDLHVTAPLIAAFLEGIEVRVIVYFRRQDEFLQSVYNQAVKGNEDRFTGDFWAYVNPILRVGGGDCMKVLLPLSKAVGKENITVRLYEKEQLKGDLFDDFLAALEIDKSFAFAKPSREQNPRLDPRLIPVVRKMNQIPMDIDLRNHLLTFLRRRYVQHGPFTHHDLLSQRQRVELLDMFRESNERVAREFLGRSDDRLFYEEEKAPETEYAEKDISKDDILEVMGALWKEYARLMAH